MKNCTIKRPKRLKNYFFFYKSQTSEFRKSRNIKLGSFISIELQKRVKKELVKCLFQEGQAQRVVFIH